MSDTLSTFQRSALNVIAGCIDGVTMGALESCGYDVTVVHELVERGLVEWRAIRLAHPRIEVVRFWITAKGAAVQRRLEKEVA